MTFKTATATTSPTVVILSLSSDIGGELALRFKREGARVVGTYRSDLRQEVRDCIHSSDLLKLDLAHPSAYSDFKHFLNMNGIRWDVFISSVGSLDPVGPFFGIDISSWEESININFLAQLKMLHASYSYKTQGLANVVFFAGGGTNGTFENYSAYCVSKIALIKMCELIDDEAKDLNTFIIGTGWVNTKIHRQTIKAGLAAGANLEKTDSFLKSGKVGTSYDEIFEIIRWGIKHGRKTVGGRNLSIVGDSWRQGGEALVQDLQSDPDKFKLRRR